MTIKRLTVFSLLLFFTVCQLPAQTSPPTQVCGTTGRSPWLDKYQAGKIAPLPKSAATQYIPVHLTIVGEDEGSGYADPLTLVQSFQLLNQDFSGLNIQFYIDGDIDYLNSSIYYDHDFNNGRDLLTNFNRRNVFNNYVVGNPAGNCGYYSAAEDAIVLGVGCINGGDRTWSHEVGHFLGLPHTFYGWEGVGEISKVEAFDKPAPTTVTLGRQSVEVERVDGSNCADAADGFCDTPPDYLPERWQCNNAGVYADSLLDPDSTRFVVHGKNIMSYANDRCVEEFSEEQITAMTTNLGGRTGLAITNPPAFAAARAEDLTILSPADRAVATYSDEVTLVWNTVPNADFYLVQLNISSNFNGSVFTSFFTSDTSAVIRNILTPNRRYYWRVRPLNRYDLSGSFSEISQFRNGATTTATIDPAFDAAISLAPNPVGGGQELRLSGSGLTNGRLEYTLFSSDGRQLLRRDGVQLTNGSFQQTISTASLSPGVYFLRMTLDGRLSTRRLVITP
ncbi:T9SS type A sorting domain-containing protein [Lewinella sp. JB7]|uniref:T9SS type A sorting domain-containing protein n=1 Tax=Lewinella sp. JB7 TaxID=2962887 RepID=UPI0020C95503|nr:T9SS type A sorting domain-containing protein [Lewinella sp. JB7]MCP9235577.1 T9SS type A sorting domain-containing protein [Lewinella sp. JB7]